MRKGILWSFCLLIAASSFACQKIPAAAGIRMQSAPTERVHYDAPEVLKTNSVSANGYTLSIDAEVIVPDCELFPIVEVERVPIMPSWAEKTMKTMAEGKPILFQETEQPHSQKEIDTVIANLKQLIADPTLEYPDFREWKQVEQDQTISDWQAEIEAWQKIYYAVPNQLAGTEIPSIWSAYAAEQRVSGMADLGKQRMAYLDVGPFDVEFNNVDDGVGLALSQAGMLDEDFEHMKGVTISKEEAIETARTYLEKLGCIGLEPVQIRAGSCMPMREDLPRSEWERCYVIILTRPVAGVPAVICNNRLDLSQPYDRLFSADTDRNGIWFTDPYQTEYAEIQVRDSGVVYLHWHMPSRFKRCIEDQVSLLPFDRITEIFMQEAVKGTLPDSPVPEKVTCRTVQIERIELAMTQGYEKGSYNSAQMIPTWIFSGKTVTQYASPQEFTTGERNEYTEGNNCYLVLNAIDGTVIHPCPIS